MRYRGGKQAQVVICESSGRRGKDQTLQVSNKTNFCLRLSIERGLVEHVRTVWRTMLSLSADTNKKENKREAKKT